MSLVRKDKFKKLDLVSQKIEKIDALNDMCILYVKQIDNYLNDITNNPVLKSQLKDALFIKDFNK